MTVNELKSYVGALVKEYFAGASVVWAGENLVHKGNPTVMLRLRNVQTDVFPVIKWVDGQEVSYYRGSAQLEVNLFTDGKSAPADVQMVVPRENTAINDLAGFLLFLGSEYVVLKNSKENINLTPLGPINDISAIRDNTEREYSAMQEYTVHFLQTAAGFAGVKDAEGNTDNSSGGAPENLKNMETGYFEEVEEMKGGTV